MRTSEQSTKVMAALVAAQAQFKSAHKESFNPHFGSKYADYAALWDSCKDGLAANKLAVLTSFTKVESELVVMPRLIHESGEWLEIELPLPIVDNKPQTRCGLTTYGKRYALAALLNLTTEDDDGNAAQGQAGEQRYEPTSGFNPESPKDVLTMNKLLVMRGVDTKLYQKVYAAMKGRNADTLPGVLSALGINQQ